MRLSTYICTISSVFDCNLIIFSIARFEHSVRLTTIMNKICPSQAINDDPKQDATTIETITCENASVLDPGPDEHRPVNTGDKGESM
jgi:hypothetical protein